MFCWSPGYSLRLKDDSQRGEQEWYVFAVSTSNVDRFNQARFMGIALATRHAIIVRKKNIETE